MDHKELTHLIQKAIITKGGIWADFGSGEGAFTLALRDLAGKDVEIYSVDKDKERIKKQQEQFAIQFPGTNIHYVTQDFTQNLIVPPLDGIIMANSLHYVKDHSSFLKLVKKYLKPKGILILVEYNIDKSNHWVPYPLSFTTFMKETMQAGFAHIELLEKIPSAYWEEMYSAKAEK